MGSYTTNLNLYKPAIGEQGWGTLVNSNFDIIDSPFDNATITLDSPAISNIESKTILSLDGKRNESLIYIPNETHITQTIADTYIKPLQSADIIVLYCDGSLTIDSGVTITTYPYELVSNLPPNTPETNTIDISNNLPSISLNATLNYIQNEIQINLNSYNSGLLTSFITKNLKNNIINIPHAIAPGGYNSSGAAGTAGTAENTCNGGGGSGKGGSKWYPGGTGCIFGQYSGGNITPNGVVTLAGGYGSSVNGKYCSALIIYVTGNLTINGSIDLHGGTSTVYTDAYGGGGPGGSDTGGGGGAPVFIYYGGTYTNNGTINTAGGINVSGNSPGGAGGIKITQIT